MRRFSLLCCLTLLSLACGNLEAVERFVNPACTNAITTYNGATHSCTGGSSTVYSSIPNGLSGMAAGDTLTITYNSGTPYVATLDATKAGSAGAPTIIRGAPGQSKPVIRPSSSSARVATLTGKRHITFDGLDLDGINVQFEVLKLVGPNCSHFRILNSRIHHGAASGLLVTGATAADQGCTDSEFINNEIDHNGFRGTQLEPTLYHGAYIAYCTRCLFERNEYHHNTGHGMKIADSQDRDGSNSNTIVRYNIMHDNSYLDEAGPNTASLRDGFMIGNGADMVAHNNLIYNEAQGCISTWRALRPRIYHNTCYSTSETGSNFGGIRIREQTSEAEVYNNIVHSLPSVCIRVGQNGATDTDLKNNTCFNTSGTVSNTGSSGTTESGTVTTNPLLINPGSQQFGLQSTSPAIDTATTIPAVAGFTRPCPADPCDRGAMQTLGLVSGRIEGTTLELNFSTSFTPILPESGITGFTARYDGSNAPISSCARTANLTVTCTMSGAPSSGSVVVDVSYSGGNLTDGLRAGNVSARSQPLHTLTNFAVTNDTGGGPPPSSGALVAHWPLDEGTGTSLPDQSGHGNTLTLQGSPATPSWTASGCPGGATNCLSFDGGDYAFSLDSASLDMTGDFTVAVWVDTSQAAAAGKLPQILRKTAGSPAAGYRIVLHDETSAEWRGEIVQGGSTYTVLGDTDVADGTAHHLLIQRCGSDLKAWEDGVLSNTTGSVSTADLSNTSPVYVGVRSDANTNYFYSGLMSEVKLWDYCLTQSEIEDEAANEAPPTTSTWIQHQYLVQHAHALGQDSDIPRGPNVAGDIVEGNRARVRMSAGRLGSDAISQAFAPWCRVPYGLGTTQDWFQVTDTTSYVRFGTDQEMDTGHVLSQKFSVDGFTFKTGGIFVEKPGGAASVELANGEYAEFMYLFELGPEATEGTTIGCCLRPESEDPFSSCTEVDLHVVGRSGSSGSP